MAGVGGCTSSRPQPFGSLAAALRSQADIADRGTTIARQEQAAAAPPAQAVPAAPADKGAVTAFRGNGVNIAV